MMVGALSQQQPSSSLSCTGVGGGELESSSCWWQAGVAGGVGGGASRMLVAPLDLAKIRMQLQILPNSNNVGKYAGLRDVLSTVVREEGYVGLWRGNLPAIFLWVGYAAIQFAIYDHLSSLMKGGERGGLQGAPLVAGAGASGVATVLTYPFDVIRTQMALQGVPRRHESIMSLSRHLYTTGGGVGAFFRGLNPTLVQIVPYMGVTFAVYEWMDNNYHPRDDDDDGGGAGAMRRSAWSALSGGVAGVTSKLAVYPLDTVKKRLQAADCERHTRYGEIPRYTSPADCARTIVRKEGVLGLYKGTLPSVLKAGIATFVTFGIFRWTSDRLRRMTRRQDSVLD